MANTVMDSLSNALDMKPLVIEDATYVKIEPNPEARTALTVLDEIEEESQDIKDARADFALARENLSCMIEKGQDALDTLLRIAQTSESPRAYEVASNLIKAMVEANKDLLSLHSKKQELIPTSEPTKEESPKTVTNNNVFVGSTAELQQLMEQMRNANRSN